MLTSAINRLGSRTGAQQGPALEAPPLWLLLTERMGWGKSVLFSQQILCATANKYSVLFSVRLLHFKILPCSPSQGALHVGH